MSKFDKPFAEIRLYLPLETEAWEQLQGASIAELLTRSGKLAVHQTQTGSGKKGARDGFNQ